MWRELKRDVKVLARDEPGQRFARFSRRHGRANEHYLSSILYILAGVVVIAIGIVLSISPIVPGFFLVIIGLGIVVTRVPPMAHWLDRMEVRARKFVRRFRRRQT